MTSVGSLVCAKSGFLSRNSADVIRCRRSSLVSRDPASFGPMTSSFSGSRSSRIRYAHTTCSRVSPPGWSGAMAREYNPQVMPNIRVMHFGLGPIGAAVVKQVAVRPGFKIVGAIDIDPAKVGRDLGDVVGLPKRLGVKVADDAAKALKAARPDVVVLCT